MTEELRVRLEGAWETLQSTTETFERAARSLSRGQTDHVARAVSLRDSEDTKRARDAVERVGRPETDALLERYRSARGAFVEALQSRAGELGLDGAADQLLVKSLETDVLWEGRAVSWDAVVLYVVLGAIVTAGGWTRLEAIPAGLAAVLVVVTLISAPKMRVTRQTIVVGHQSFKVGEVRFCRVKRVSRDTGRSRSTTTYLQFEFDAERVESVRVPTIPGGFYAAMNALGLPPISV